MDGSAHTGYRELLQVAADRSRWRILALLSAGPCTVGDLVERLDLGQPSVSHHLGRLRVAGLVEAVTEGRQRRYQWADPGRGTALDGVHRELRRWVSDQGRASASGPRALRRPLQIEPHLL